MTDDFMPPKSAIGPEDGSQRGPPVITGYGWTILLMLGGTVSAARTAATYRRLLDADADRCHFVAVPRLEPTHNGTERALRHSVIWRRSSHGTQSDVSSRFVERFLTVVETCHRQQRPVFDFLRDALIAYRAGQPAPSLLPTH
jgi:transposase